MFACVFSSGRPSDVDGSSSHYVNESLRCNVLVENDFILDDRESLHENGVQHAAYTLVVVEYINHVSLGGYCCNISHGPESTVIELEFMMGTNRNDKSEMCEIDDEEEQVTEPIFDPIGKYSTTSTTESLNEVDPGNRDDHDIQSLIGDYKLLISL